MRRGAVILAVVLAGCSANRPSDDLRCDDDTTCTGGRFCQDGYCVFDPDRPDAGVDADPRCPSPCTSCSGLFDDAGGFMTCNVDCGQNGSCPSTVVCPAGMDCTVSCTGINSCGNGVDCSAGNACTITCNGTNACADDVVCGAGACTVSCIGNNACGGGLDCSSSCACDVTCGAGACDNGPAECPGSACQAGDGCSSALPGCNTCL